jgi:hypothetical protein
MNRDLEAAMGAAPPHAAGGWSRPLPGFAQCGDAFLVERGAGGGLLVAVADGLGHGAEASVAANAAVRVIRDGLDRPVAELLTRCDQALRATRGAAVGVLRVAADGRGEFCGVGNIEVHGIEGRPPGLFCQAGIVGQHQRPMRTLPFAMERGDIYCVHSDGVSNRGDLRGCLPGTPEAVARRIVEGWGRPHDDATAVVLGYAAGRRLADGTETGARAAQS